MNRPGRFLIAPILTVLLAVPGTGAVAALPPAGPAVALLSKVILEVLRKEAGKDWEKAVRGQTLASGDMLRTGPGALAIIKFKDNSLVRLREKSELTVTGKQSGNSLSKSVEITTGVVGFNVQKQRAGEEFRFTSPTSVASIRGTAGMLHSTPASDTLTVTEGLVALTNKRSSRNADVPSGFTGISSSDGTLLVRRSTPNEQRSALEALRDDQRKRLEIELRDPQGKTNRLKIEYND